MRRRDDEETALVAVFLHAFAFPLLLFIERAFMNEALLICLSLTCLVAAQAYLARRSVASLAALIIGSTLIATIKLPYWHLVVMNTETRARAMEHVAFLD